MTDNADADLLRPGQTWQQLLERASFIELDALQRARTLADPGSLRVLCGPFDRLESPWLEPQGITPQSDDGTVIGRATIAGQPVVIASIEQRFSGGGTGEVSGAKISEALKLATIDSRQGYPTAALILFETGGVRLQEANLGLNAVAEVCSALLDLRDHAPVIGIVAGTVGCFGGMSIVAGLCTSLIVTTEARIGLNGPAVIEQEAGADEFDSSDHSLIWAIDGGHQRRATGLADTLVADSAEEIRATVIDALARGPLSPEHHRSRRIDVLLSRLASIDPSRPPLPEALQQLWGERFDVVVHQHDSTRQTLASPAASQRPESRGATWLKALSRPATPHQLIGSVLRARTDTAVYLAVVPDPHNPFHRAREGQVGLTESLALAEAIREIVDVDGSAGTKRAIVAVVDLPSQAYGRIEEMVGLHQAMASTVDAYHQARTCGHPVIALIVGSALSGGFLTHGLQANQLLALDDSGVEIHAMHKAAAARITLRTPQQLDTLAKSIPPMSYRVEDWATLGFCDALLKVDDADAPTDADIASVGSAIAAAIERARVGPQDLSNRLNSPAAVNMRRASREVRDRLCRDWNSESATPLCPELAAGNPVKGM